MQGYTPGEQPKGGRIIKLNTNENPYPPSAGVCEALKNFNPETLRKYPDPVAAPLRRALAQLHATSPSNIFVGNGSDEVLALCTRAFVENDGVIGYFDPSYSLYPVLSDIRDVRQVSVPLSAGFGWKPPPLQGIELFFLTNPNAPTGMLFKKSDVEAFCRDFWGVVLIDEAYVDFAAEDCIDLALKYPNVLVSRTFSKSYSLAGLRVGYAVGDAALIAAMDKIKDSYNLDAPAQALALAAVEDVECMRSNAAKIKATRSALSASLAAAGFEVCPSEANFIWCRPPQTITAAELFAKLKNAGILIRYFDVDGISDYVRITVGTDDEVGALLRKICEILQS